MSKYWGTPTWYFFHSFAQHIDDDFYMKNRHHICNMLRSVCHNLPCEDCTKHSVLYTRNTLNGNYIKTKQDLQDYFYTFHNSVNVRNRRRKFSNYDMYKTSKLSPITQKFFGVYGRSGNPIRGFSDQMNRNQIINNIKSFFKSNMNQFTWL